MTKKKPGSKLNKRRGRDEHKTQMVGQGCWGELINPRKYLPFVKERKVGRYREKETSGPGV